MSSESYSDSVRFTTPRGRILVIAGPPAGGPGGWGSVGAPGKAPGARILLLLLGVSRMKPGETAGGGAGTRPPCPACGGPTEIRKCKEICTKCGALVQNCSGD